MIVEAEKKTGWIGRATKRVGGRERVSGALQYVGDIHIDGMLHVKLVHLPCGHARIHSIDTTEAMRVDGVRSIVTADDLPHPMPRFGPRYKDRPIIAEGETKYFGEPVYEYGLAQAMEDGYLAACEIQMAQVNLDATGLTADLHTWGAQGRKSSVREVLSRVKAVADGARVLSGGGPNSELGGLYYRRAGVV